MKNYYAILGISEHADAQEIKKAYRKLAKKYHPDAVRDNAAKMQNMYDIQEAYECLGDAEKRKSYDESRKSPSSFGGRGNKTDAKNRDKDVHRQETGYEQGSVPGTNAFEQFFGFQPGRGMETYQDKRTREMKKQGPVCSDEIFAQFFGNPGKRKRGGGR